MMQGVLIVEKGERKRRESDEKEAGTSSNFQFLQLMGEGNLTIVPGEWLSGANLKVILFVLGFCFFWTTKKVISRFNQMF